MNHKYLEGLIKKGKSPYDFQYDDVRRNKLWDKEREEYGFDERETWNLDFTFFCWLYERLLKYKEVNNADLEAIKIKVKNEEKTLLYLIDVMINNSKQIISEEIEDENLIKLEDETLEVFKETLYYLWW